jgi:hypothetical protein
VTESFITTERTDTVTTDLTDLERICDALLGVPTRRSGNGVSYYDHCPKCDEDCYTLEDVPQYRHRLRCWHCHQVYDRWDVMRLVRPDLNWDQQRAMIDDILASRPADSPCHFLPRGSRSRTRASKPHDMRCGDPAHSGDMTGIVRHLEDLIGHPTFSMEQGAVLRVVVAALRQCGERGIDPADLADTLDHFEKVGRCEQQHTANCLDPDCDSVLCLIARGWSKDEVDDYYLRLRYDIAEKKAQKQAEREAAEKQAKRQKYLDSFRKAARN